MAWPIRRSPRPARRWPPWSVLCLIALAALPVAAEEPGATQEGPVTYFRIGTGSAGGTYFPVGGLIASAITFRPGGRDCNTGACGVPNLIAVSQVTKGSVENATEVESGKLDSGLVQADVAHWMYAGQWIFSGKKPAGKLRAIANLYTENIQLVARRDAGIHTVADLKGKRVSVGEAGSGTEVDAKVVLGGFGLTEAKLRVEHVGLVNSADLLREGKLDAFFLVSGAPSSAVSELADAAAAGGMAVTLVPIVGEGAARIRRAHPFYTESVIAGGTYRGIPPTATIGVAAEWLVSEDADSGLIYEITRALWNKAARDFLDSGHPEGRNIRIETALDGLAVPLHPGAERFYREVGLIKP